MNYKIGKPYKLAKQSHITQSYSDKHRAIDLAFYGCYGTPLLAMEDSVVEAIMSPDKFPELAELDRGYNIVLHKVGDPATQFAYFHTLPFFPVEVGETVKRGQIVAQLGNSGIVRTLVNGEWQLVPLEKRPFPPYPGSHLHFIVRQNYQPVDPVPLIFWEEQTEHIAGSNLVSLASRFIGFMIKKLEEMKAKVGK